MANIQDYLAWRGDVTFEYDPFNVVDNLVFSALSYVDLEGIMTAPDGIPAVSAEPQLMPVTEVSDQYFTLHTQEEIKARETSTKNMPLLLPAIASSRRFQEVRLWAYENHIDEEKDAQMAAVTFFLDPHTAYVAFRGTDNTIVGWKEDFELSYLKETSGQRLAVEYLNRHFSSTDLTLYVGGHSKGGNFAIYASAFCNPSVKKQIRAIFANDAPGFLEEVSDSPQFQEIQSRVVTILPEESMIGRLLRTGQAQYIVKSSAKGLMQHDLLSWQVIGNHLEDAASRSGASLFVEDTLQNWLDKIDDQQRRTFVEALFSFFESTGHETFEQIRKNSFSSMQKMLEATKTMPKEDRDQMVNILWQLVKSGTNTMLGNLISSVSPFKSLPEEKT